MTEHCYKTLDSFVLLDHEESSLMQVPSIGISTNSLEKSSVDKNLECSYSIVDNKTIIENNQRLHDNLNSQDCSENLKFTLKMYNNFEIIDPPESISLNSIEIDQEKFDSDLITCKDDIVISKNNLEKSLDVIDEMKGKDTLSNIKHDEKQTNCSASINHGDNKLNLLETFENATNEWKNKKSECKEVDLNIKDTAVELCLPLDVDNIIDFEIKDESLYKSDDVDFRVNILNKNVLNDSWTPSMYIHKEDDYKTNALNLNTEYDKNENHNESTIDTNINVVNNSEIVVKTNVDCHTVLSKGEVKFDEYITSSCLSIPEDSLVCLSGIENSVHNIDETRIEFVSADDNVADSDDNYVSSNEMDNDTGHTVAVTSVINRNNEAVHGTNDSQLPQDISFQTQMINCVEDEAKIVRISNDLTDSTAGNESSVHNIDETRIEFASDDNVADSDDNYVSSNEMDNDTGHPEAATSVLNRDNEAVHGTNDSQLLQDITQAQMINCMEDDAEIAGIPSNLPDSAIGNESSIIPKSIGIKNPQNFKSMNSVIGMLFNCFGFRAEMINYHRSDQIANIDMDMLSDVTVNDACFVNDLCLLFALLTEEENKNCHRVARSIRQYILNDHSLELDVYQGFQYILLKIDAIIKTVINQQIASATQADIDFDKYRFTNHGFISDLFYGQILHKKVCENCHFIHSEYHQPINSISLKIEKLGSSNTLDDCIRNYFKPTIEESNGNYQCCVQPVVKIFQEITHAPEYFFIYIDRKLEIGEIDHTYFETDNGLLIKTKNELVLYSIISVIDEDILNQYNSHTVKCLTDHWWAIDNYGARKIPNFGIITEISVGFMLKKLNET